MTTDGIDFTNITVAGIPDGVSPLANESLINKNAMHRLYIFADKEMPTQYLETIDRFFGKQSYPIIACTTPAAIITTLPQQNFYLTNGPPSSISTFVEYRYLDERHLMTNIAYDVETNAVYRLVLPEKQLLVIIMPNNFIRTGLKTGYFRFANNIIVRVYSRYMLSSSFVADDTHEITVYNNSNLKLKSEIEQFFSRLGMHKIVSIRSNQIYAYDKYMTMVVGSISNIVLPP